MKKILTKQDIIDLGNPARLLVPVGTVITPLALGHANARHMGIEQSREVDAPVAAPDAPRATVGVGVDRDLLDQVRHGLQAAAGSGTTEQAGECVDGHLMQAVIDEVLRAMGGTPGEDDPAPIPDAPGSPAQHLYRVARRQQERGGPPHAGSGRAAISVTGTNTPGVAAVFCQVMADCGVDIVDISQTIVSGYYTMLFIVDLAGLEGRGLSLLQFRERLQAVAEGVGAQAWVMHENVLKAMNRL